MSGSQWHDEPCDAVHDGHDCSVPGECGRALLKMLERSRERERQHPRSVADGREV